MTLILNGTDNSATVPAVQGGTAGTSTGLYYPTTSAVGISTAGTNAVYIDASQNVGIGVTPSAWGSNYKALQIGTRAAYTQGSSDTYIGNNWYNDGANKYIATAAACLYGQSSGSHLWLIAPSGTAGNTIAWTQAMTLDSSGNLGIGTSSPSTYVANGGLALANAYRTSSAAFSIYNTSGASASNIAKIDFKLNNTFSNGSPSASITALNPNASGNNGGALVFATSANGTNTTPTEAMRIDSSGNVGIGTNSPGFKLEVQGVNDLTFTNDIFTASLTGTDAYNSGNSGGGVQFRGKYTSGGNFTTFGGIWCKKENTTDSTYGAYLAFGTRTNGTAGSDMERMRITSSGNVLVGLTAAG